LLLTAVRTIKVRDIDKALVILSKGDRQTKGQREREGKPGERALTRRRLMAIPLFSL
jgi:hypothetical protein